MNTRPELIDLSQPVFDNAPNCPAHRPVHFSITSRHEANGWQMEEIAMATHTGSHVDAPLHKLAGGPSISDYPLTAFVGPATIVDLRGLAADARISRPLLISVLPDLAPGSIVLLATSWGDRRAKTAEWLEHSPRVDPSGAHWLVEHGVAGVGIDHVSIGGIHPENEETHTILLGSGAWIVEELKFPESVFRLDRPARYWGVPLNWPGCSGAFCRPFLELLPASEPTSNPAPSR